MVLFIGLVALVIMILSTIALIRSTDTAALLTGNLGLKQAAASAVDRSVEQSVHALFDTALVPDKTADHLAQNYYASVGRNADGSIPQIPKVLQEPFSPSAFAAAGLNAGVVPADDGGNSSFYVIERMCLSAGPPVGSNCNLSSNAFGADPGTQHYTGLIRPGDAYYRVTVRISGPRNSVSYAQSMLK
jgi:hypothetical protein